MSSPVERSARPQLFRGVLPSIPKETDTYITAQWPQAAEEERKQIFHKTATSFGGAQRGFAAAVEYFKTAYYDLLLGVTPLGPDRPPPNAALREARVDDSPLAVFYHSTYPPALQHAAPFMWTFYIGLQGQERSIMLKAEREKRGIRLLALNMEEEWQEFTLFQVPASTRVRIEYAPYLTSTSPKRRTVELVFPAVPPTQGPIPVQQLL
ncbi:hypothetical protein B0H11DRAFT_1916458 [Mycena galericulata]|nr:hypothetical protein B0H11DRAFT_1916458 [Mycena galericulata]